MSQATQNVIEDAGSVTVCAEINNMTLPFQRSTTVLLFTVGLSAGNKFQCYIYVLRLVYVLCPFLRSV